MLRICLLNRNIVEISGKDTLNLLQGLITQDINLLKHQNTIATLLLNNKGKYLLDFFISKYHDSFLIDIAENDIELLLEIINKYKLRSQVNIKVNKSFKVYSIFCNSFKKISSNFLNYSTEDLSTIITSDPRLNTLGLRLITKQNNFLHNQSILKVINYYFNNSTPIKFSNIIYYKNLRYLYTVPESTELIKEKSIPLECNLDYLNTISFNKGCYLGQEFTNASKRTLIIRKRLVTFKIDLSTHNCTFQMNDKILNLNKEKVGILVAKSNTYIIALIRVNAIKNNNCFYCNNIKIIPIIPFWLKNIIN